MNICLFKKEELENPLSFSDERGEHIIKILHKKEGDTFFAGVINSKSGKATITKIENKQIFFTFEPESDGKPLYPLKMMISAADSVKTPAARRCGFGCKSSSSYRHGAW